MPELPEAEVAARQIRANLAGARLVKMTVGRDDIIREGGGTIGWYAESVVTGVERVGKSVVLACRRGGETRYLVAELGMTGLLLFPSVAIRFPQHVHVTLELTGGQVSSLRYWNPRRFGRMSFFDREGLSRYRARRFGPDALTVTGPEFLAVLRAHRRRLKALLMHQQVIAGIGNIYANEILFRARLHPNTVASCLSEGRVAELHGTMQAVLRQAIECGGSSVKDFFAPDGTEGQYKRHHLVYGKDGQLCPNGCGALIRRLSSERSAFVCLRCQPLRRASRIP